MGMLVDGRWQKEDLAEFTRGGDRVRFSSGFDARIGAAGEGRFPAEAGRYALYCNRTCPWSHRALVARALKGLDAVVDLVLLEPAMGPQNWWFGTSGEYSDPAIGATHLHQLYSASEPGFTGRVSIPVLWDKSAGCIVNNDSGVIARLFNDEFDALADHPEVDLAPAPLRAEVDHLNDFIGDRVTDGVYRCVLAREQADYDTAVDTLFETLDELDARLATRRFLLGERPTEPDFRLFASLIRFDPVYYSLYKCNLRRIIDYRYLWDYTRDIYQWPGVSGTVDMDAMKRGYYGIFQRGKPVPKGPLLDLDAPHGRERLA